MDLVSQSGNPNSVSTIINPNNPNTSSTISSPAVYAPSRYENQKRRDWNTFGQYLRNHRPPLSLSLCNGAHVLEFLRYLDHRALLGSFVDVSS
ncbi:unnamed protein product, partial [Vitis vinifera]